MKKRNGLEEIGGFNFPKELAEGSRISALERNQLHLYGEVNEEMAEYVREGLLYIQSKTPEGRAPTITAFLTSPGGMATFGLEIHDLFTLYQQHGVINGIVVGHACSAASMFILQGCTNRIATENASIMCHNGGFELGQPLTRKDFEDPEWQEKMRREFARGDTRAIRILKNRTKRTEKEIKKLLEREEDLSADEAFDFGLLDQVIKFSYPKKPARRATDKKS